MNGVNVIVGSDHGCGTSQLLAKVNYESALERRKTDTIEGGSRVIQYGCVKCRKDKEPILRQVAPSLNKTIHDLDKEMLIGAYGADKNIDVVYTAKESRESIRAAMNNGKAMKEWCTAMGGDKSTGLKHLPSKAVKTWPVIENFYYIRQYNVIFYLART